MVNNKMFKILSYVGLFKSVLEFPSTESHVTVSVDNNEKVGISVFFVQFTILISSLSKREMFECDLSALRNV